MRCMIDGLEEWNANGVVDLSPDRESTTRPFVFPFRLSEFSPRLRENDRSWKPQGTADGSLDGQGSYWTNYDQNDGRLTFRAESSVKADFLTNANLLRANANAPPGTTAARLPPPVGQEFGI